MPRRSLTDRFCQTAKPLGPQTDYFDEGHPGLALRVTEQGARSWTYLFTWGVSPATGRPLRARMTFGAYPAISLAAARTRADDAKRELAEGRDPRSAKAETLREVCEKWVARDQSRTAGFRATVLARLVFPVLGPRPIADIRRSDIVRLLDDVEEERGAAMADKTFSILRAVFNWHAVRSDDFHNPIVKGIRKGSGQSRDRILSDDELRTVWRVAETQGAFGRLVKFLLLTGARRTEAAAMPWSEIDGSDWLLPGARNKTGLDLLRPLSPMALAQLGERSSGFVFSNDGVLALRGYASLKLAFDQAVTAELGEAMPNWTLHDLRRSARSLMSRAGIPSDHAERVLGHVIGGVRGVYDRHAYRDEKAHALLALARLVDRIVTGKPTVLTLRTEL
jgi:integrase